MTKNTTFFSALALAILVATGCSGAPPNAASVTITSAGSLDGHTFDVVGDHPIGCRPHEAMA